MRVKLNISRFLSSASNTRIEILTETSLKIDEEEYLFDDKYSEYKNFPTIRDDGILDHNGTVYAMTNGKILSAYNINGELHLEIPFIVTLTGIQPYNDEEWHSVKVGDVIC